MGESKRRRNGAARKGGPTPQSMADIWAGYVATNLKPINAGPVQTKWCQHAFFTGANWLLQMMMDTTESMDSPERDLLWMDSIRAELRAYSEQVKREEAEQKTGEQSGKQ